MSHNWGCAANPVSHGLIGPLTDWVCPRPQCPCPHLLVDLPVVWKRNTPCGHSIVCAVKSIQGCGDGLEHLELVAFHA